MVEAGVRWERDGLLLHGRIDVNPLDLGLTQRLLALSRRERLGQQLLHPRSTEYQKSIDQELTSVRSNSDFYILTVPASFLGPISSDLTGA